MAKKDLLSTTTPSLKLRDVLRAYRDDDVIAYAQKLAKKVFRKGQKIKDKSCIVNALQMTLQSGEREHFVVIFVDNALRILATRTLFVGSVSSVEINCREILRQALLENATGIFLAHNHPSGDPNPSDSDITVTQEIVESARHVDVRVLDHVIVSVEGCFSFAQAGYL